MPQTIHFKANTHLHVPARPTFLRILYVVPGAAAPVQATENSRKCLTPMAALITDGVSTHVHRTAKQMELTDVTNKGSTAWHIWMAPLLHRPTMTMTPRHYIPCTLHTRATHQGTLQCSAPLLGDSCSTSPDTAFIASAACETVPPVSVQS